MDTASESVSTVNGLTHTAACIVLNRQANKYACFFSSKQVYIAVKNIF